MTSGILVIQFRQPVDIPVDRLGAAASEYIGAARRDPDGRALRFALAQKVKLSSMVAGDRLFVDLLPESWTGEPPGLPREVVEELARRANEAERLARSRSSRSKSSARFPAVRVRVAGQPTFTRYIFELPELTGVTAERGKDKLTLTFARSLRFDLSDAKLASAKAVAAVDAGGSGDTSEVQFKFSQAADVRTFREDSNYVVDVSPIDAKAPAAAATGPLAGIARAGNHTGASSRRTQMPALRRRRRRPPRRCPRSPPMKPSRRRASEREPAPAPAARAAARSQPPGDRRASASGRQSAAVLSVRGADAGGGVPARRHAVARVRHQGRARCRRARQRPEQDHPQRRGVARGRCAGRAPQARTAAPHQRRAAGFRLARHGRRGDGGRDQAADRRPQHRRPGPHQHHHPVRRAAQGALAERRRHRRQASGHHRARVRRAA